MQDNIILKNEITIMSKILKSINSIIACLSMLTLFSSWTIFRHDANGPNANNGTMGRCLIEALGDERVMELLNEYRIIDENGDPDEILSDFRFLFFEKATGDINYDEDGARKFSIVESLLFPKSSCGFTLEEEILINSKIKNDSIILWWGGINYDSIGIVRLHKESVDTDGYLRHFISPFKFMSNYIPEYQEFLRDNKLKDNKISYYLFYRHKLESFVNLPVDSSTVAWGMMDDFPYDRYYKPIPEMRINIRDIERYSKRNNPINLVKRKIYGVVSRLAGLLKCL